MDSTNNIIRTRTEKYDPTTGQNVREIKSSDIVILKPTLASSDVATGDTSLASTTTDAYHNLYLIGYGFSSTNAEGVGCLSYSNGTYLSQYMGAGGMAVLGNSPDRFALMSSKDAPLLKIPVSTTVTLRFNAVTAGTVSAYAVFIKEPIPAYVETE